MQQTPQALRLHIGIFGRMNVGKSSLLNHISGQSTAIVSETLGTTSDAVRKNMELAGLGPVSFIDTAGFDDTSSLQKMRLVKMEQVFSETDIALLVLEPNIWTEKEETFLQKCQHAQLPIIAIINKIDVAKPSHSWLKEIQEKISQTLSYSCGFLENTHELAFSKRSFFIESLIQSIKALLPESFFSEPILFQDLLPPQKEASLIIFVTPIDASAPKGRLIMPQVQSLREGLDSQAISLLVKEGQYEKALKALQCKPDLVIADSQVASAISRITDASIAFTTFSILFSRLKGDIKIFAQGAANILSLKDGDKILIAEACTHHAQDDDIGSHQIPEGLRRFTAKHLDIHHFSGKDYPKDLESYALIIHCGACTLNRRLMLDRMQTAHLAQVPITNYGMVLSLFQGSLERCLSPFPEALSAFKAFSHLENSDRDGDKGPML
ncbi:MAG TPA: [FeFe] hydrogenase H-cluster maturation GTPase HydF [Treponemataceae bacterium]|nr:[FeFe] hydrogenase H-cluster maturation GTPase HydF [Treponemataceae bacterium]